MSNKIQPLLCSGHTRPVTHLQFSNKYVILLSFTAYTICSGAYENMVCLFSYTQPLCCRLDDGSFLLISACKDGNPMLRNWLGDWVGTFLGQFADCYQSVTQGPGLNGWGIVASTWFNHEL
jgi:serine-threonine kinase receptor-associated protein